MKTIEAVVTTTAAPVAVWALIADASSWSRWGSWSRVDVEGGGEQGLGAIRVLAGRGFEVRERITGWVPGERLEYEMIEGMRVSGYRSAVTVEPADDGGSVLRWRSTYEKAGPITAVILRLAVRDSCKRLARAAARR